MSTRNTLSAPPRAMTPTETARYQRNSRLALPFTLLVPVAIGGALHVWGVALNWPAVGIGAAGWVLALVLRTPFSLLLKAALKTPERAQPWVTALSGPCEESLRLVALLVVGRSFPLALSVGLGWAAIEVVYGVVNGLALSSLLTRTDAQAAQARELLATLGMDRALTPMAPFAGILERFSASLLHLGFTLMIAWQPWLVLATIPLHSLTNLGLVRVLRRSLALSEVLVLALGLLVFVAGLALFGRL
jgi:hypothetical protein